MSELLILGQQRNGRDGIVPSLLAAAHFRRERVRCLCCSARPEMYVSRTRTGFTVKRLPNSGETHASGCRSFGQVIQRNTSTTREFIPKIDPHLAEASESMLKLLQDLWQRAGLMHWRPTFEGRRPWAVVRSRLLRAATNPGSYDGAPPHLYIPEQFSIASAEAITSRREAYWTLLADREATMLDPLLVGELNRCTPNAQGATLTIRHIPGILFRVSVATFAWLQYRFACEFESWQSAKSRLVIAALLNLANRPAPSLGTLALLSVDRRWLPAGELGG